MKTPPSDLAERLLDVSEQVLFGDPPPRLEDVARLVGASRATLYYYFSGRDDLLTFLLNAHVRRGAETVRNAVDPDDPPICGCAPRWRPWSSTSVTIPGCAQVFSPPSVRPGG